MSPTMGKGRRRVRRALVVAAVAATGAGALGACTTARNALGTKQSSCALSLPTAESAVDHRGTFAGVHLASVSELDRFRIHRALEARLGGRLGSVCVYAFKGTYTRSQVMAVLGRGPKGGVGHVAVVFVASPSGKLLGTLLFAKEPERFSRLFIGGA